MFEFVIGINFKLEEKNVGIFYVVLNTLQHIL